MTGILAEMYGGNDRAHDFSPLRSPAEDRCAVAQASPVLAERGLHVD